MEIKGWHDAAYARDRVVRATKLFDEAKQHKAEDKLKPVAVKQKVAAK